MITIITTCKGRVHHLKGLVECLQRQTFRDWECVVVAYGCEETRGYMYLLMLEDNRFSQNIVAVEGFNLSKARNCGLRYVNDQWVGMLDADTIITDDFLQRQWDQIQNTQKAFFTGEPECSGNCFFHSSDLEIWAGYYDEEFEGWGAEDADLYIRLQHKCPEMNKVKCVPGMSYQDHPESESDKFHSIKKWDAQKKNIQRLFSKYPKEWIVPEYIAPELVSRFI